MTNGRKIEQAGIGILHLDAERAKPGQAGLELRGGSSELVGSRLAHRVAAAVPGDDLRDLMLIAAELPEPGSRRDHSFGERTHLHKGAVSLGRSEGLGHGGGAPF